VQPLLKAFPLPNGPDLGDGTAAFSASYSDPSTVDSYGVRIDYLLSPKFVFFGRYNDAPSTLDQRGAGTFEGSYNCVSDIGYHTRTLTIGASQALTPRLTNEARFNYSRSGAQSIYKLDNFGGAVPPTESLHFPSFASAQNDSFNFVCDFHPYGLSYVDGNAAAWPASRSTSSTNKPTLYTRFCRTSTSTTIALGPVATTVFEWYSIPGRLYVLEMDWDLLFYIRRQRTEHPIPQYFNLNYALEPGDRTHVFHLTGIAELPFGMGKRLVRRSYDPAKTSEHGSDPPRPPLYAQSPNGAMLRAASFSTLSTDTVEKLHLQLTGRRGAQAAGRDNNPQIIAYRNS
jgi:hypothetical protein